MMESGTGTGSGLMWAVGAIFLLIVLAVFIPGRGFGRDGGYDGGGYGYRGGHDDGYCGVKGCRPAYYDESNYEEEKHINEKLCKVDNDVHAEGELTRGVLYTQENQRLRDIIYQKDLELQACGFKNAINESAAKTNAELAEIKCKMLDKPNVYAYSYIEDQPRPRCERPRRCRDDEWDAA